MLIQSLEYVDYVQRMANEIIKLLILGFVQCRRNCLIQINFTLFSAIFLAKLKTATH